jgi:hypothetical protein
MAHALQLPRPVVSAPASFHHHQALRVVAHEPGEAPTRKSISALNSKALISFRYLKTVLCQINAHGRSIHSRTSPVGSL